MRKLILLLMILPGISFAGTQVFAPFFIVGGTLKADSLAARALTLTSSANIASLTINSDYTFPTSDGSADQILKTNGSGTLSWGSFTGAGAGGWTDGGVNVTLTTASDLLGIGVAPAAPNKIYALNSGLAMATGVGYRFHHYLSDTTANPSGTYYPIGLESRLAIYTKKGQTYTLSVNPGGAFHSNLYIRGKGTVSALANYACTSTIYDAVSVTAMYGNYFNAPSDATTGTIANFYGTYFPSYTTAGFITQGWGIYQAGTADKNCFMGITGFGDNTIAGTYDVEVGDSVQIGGNLLLGAYGGAYSYIHPGSAGFTASSTRDIKVVGSEKKVNVLPLIKSLPVYEWRFDADKIKDKFKEPAGFDTLSVAVKDSIRTDFLSKAAFKAASIAKEKHVSPLAEDWYAISQYFGGNPKEISGEHVMWALMLAVKQLNARCDSLESRIKTLEVTRTMPIEVKDE